MTAPDTEQRLREYLKRVTAELRQSRARVAELEERTTEPVAIVGTACRYPGGVSTPDQLWDLVTAGTDAISGFPEDRGWTADLYRDSTVRQGGFLHDAALFDPEFFGINPREAPALDPQQRLLLETAWEALEQAGLRPADLAGSLTGVFTGVMYADYGARLQPAPDDLRGYLVVGSAGSVVSGRIAYSFGFEGPAVTVDTACSSSLVAIHLAARSLRAGECTLALAGGVTVMATPATYVDFDRQGANSPDGRCRSFAAAADGTGWSEGAGLVLLERLADARRLGHPVLAVLRGSAINQDGRSGQLTAPHGPSQERVIRAALADAGLSTEDVDVVEAHGTGTRLGDPIEAQALINTYGRRRTVPLLVGSLKSNLGHTQAAAGVGGVIKIVQALRYGVVPATLHVDEPTPHVDWSDRTVELARTNRPWPRTDRPRRAAVSSFGISGTNAHLILEAAPASPAATAAADLEEVAWPLSARTGLAVRHQAARLAAALRTSDRTPAEVAAALAARTTFDHRAVVVGRDPGDLLTRLGEYARGADPADVAAGRAVPAGRLAFLFTGQGSQRAGMGRELTERYPVFATAHAEAVAALGTPPGEIPDDDTGRAQPALFALQVGLFRLLESWGVRPDVVAGHSVGELAAAHVAGVLSLPDAARLVDARARLMSGLPPGGAMAAVEAGEPEVRDVLAGLDGRATVAAINGPAATVIAGDEDAVRALTERFRSAGHRVTRLRTSHAFHSPRMDPILDDLGRVAEGLTHRAPAIPLVSALDGEIHDADHPIGAGHWAPHARRPVRFLDTVRRLAAEGVTAYLELGPDAVLTALVPPALSSGQAGGAQPVLAAALRRDRPETRTLLTAVAAVHAHGTGVDWTAVLGTPARHVDLPSYPFQRGRYWAQPPATADGRYRAAWHPIPVPATGAAGDWLLLVPTRPESPWPALLEAALEHAGARVRSVEVKPGALHPDEMAALVRDAGTATMLSLLPLDTGPAPGLPAVPWGLASTAALVRAADAADSAGRIWSLTRGAVARGPAERITDPDAATVWGLGAVAATESRRWGGLLDLPPTADAGAAARVVAVLAGRHREAELLNRPEGTFARRLVPAGPRPAGAPWQPDGTVLITGGTGALAGHTARWLARRGARNLLLAGRRGPAAPGATELVAELAALGADATVAACDVSDREAVAALLARIPADRPLRAVFHTAAVLDDALLSTLDPAQLDRVLRVKAGGARHLDELTRALDLNAFVLYSSAAGIVGGTGQGTYAPGNAYLDALATRRRADGYPATSIAWGLWAGTGGDGIADEVATDQARRRGFRLMTPERAVALLGEALDGDETALIAADADWDALAGRRPHPLLAELVAGSAEPATDDDGDDAARLRDELAPASAQQRRDRLIDLVRAEIAAVQGRGRAAAIDLHRGFKDHGFDSLTSVELRNRLIHRTGLALPVTLVFDHPTPLALAGELLARLVPDQAAPVADAGDEALRERLAAAGDDDLIAFINTEFGIA